MFISFFSINGYECEGFGFKIMNCKFFIFKLNILRKIEIMWVKCYVLSGL